MSHINGVVIALVTEINDNGTVKVKFPWLPDGPETDWIRIATAMSGNDRGTFFMPEVDDEVLCSFDHGDTSFPYVVGFLWNGVDRPPINDKNVRKIKTTSGHIIEFDDNGGSEKILIKSQSGHIVELDDASPGKITVKTKDKNFVEINDAGPGKIEVSSNGSIDVSAKGGDIGIKASGNVNIKASGGSVSVTAMGNVDLTATGSISTTAMGSTTISSPAGALTIDCLSATIMAKASLNINAPMVNFMGVVNIPMLIANVGKFDAVVSSVYNPGVIGTLIGL